MLTDILEGGWIPENELKIAMLDCSFSPTVLVTSHDQFIRYFNAMTVHSTASWLKSQLRELGINRILWGEYLKDNEFELTSEKSYKALGYDVESITILEREKL